MTKPEVVCEATSGSTADLMHANARGGKASNSPRNDPEKLKLLSGEGKTDSIRGFTSADAPAGRATVRTRDCKGEMLTC